MTGMSRYRLIYFTDRLRDKNDPVTIIVLQECFRPRRSDGLLG